MTSSNSQIHNDIMAVGSKERPLMLALAEAIHMILNGIGNDIYSIMDACPNAKEMWNAIEHLQQGESINIQDVKTQLFWKFNKFTSRDGESIESYNIRFYKMMNEMARNKLKQHQNEVNEIRAERKVRNANPVALVAATQHCPDNYHQAPKPYKTQAPSPRQTTSTRSHATTRNKVKDIVKAPFSLDLSRLATTLNRLERSIKPGIYNEGVYMDTK
ncbi:hypothetical protein Tco_1084535 [Tanacetum coccineum]